MKSFLILLILNFIFLLIFDCIWFSFSLESLYKPMFLQIQQKPLRFRLWSGIIVWFLIALGITFIIRFFCIKNIFYSLWIGLLTGFIIYGVYNFTNYSTFEKYTLKVTIFDTLWGTFLVGIVTFISSLFYLNFIQ